VKVECQCGRTAMLPPSAFDGLPNYPHVIDLKERLRCDNCGERGRVMVSVLWADYPSRRGVSACRGNNFKLILAVCPSGWLTVLREAEGPAPYSDRGRWPFSVALAGRRGYAWAPRVAAAAPIVVEVR
jgi:hypothetical protein